MVSAEQLAKQFGARAAVEALDLDVAPGELAVPTFGRERILARLG